MNLIDISLKRPTAVVAAVLMIIVFGLVALRTIPIQLTPDGRLGQSRALLRPGADPYAT